MTENQKQKIDNLINALPKHDRELYREISEYAVELGYSPSKAKSPNEPVDFSRNVNNCVRKLCKISPPNPAKQQGNTGFALSFYTVTESLLNSTRLNSLKCASNIQALKS